MATSSTTEPSSNRRRVVSRHSLPFADTANSKKDHSHPSAVKSDVTYSIPPPPPFAAPPHAPNPGVTKPSLPPRNSTGPPPTLQTSTHSLSSASAQVEPPQALLWRPPQMEKPPTPQVSAPPSNPTTPASAGTGKVKRKSWFPGITSSSSPSSKGQTNGRSAFEIKAWIAGEPAKPAYDLQPLLRGHSVNELWDESGDTLIYLFPKSSAMGPSFKLGSYIYASSTGLAEGARQSLNGHVNSSSTEATSQIVSRKAVPSASGESRSSTDTRNSQDDPLSRKLIKLYLPVSMNAAVSTGQAQLSDTEVEMLVDIRNAFAFLVGQALVATERRSSIFSIFMHISKILQTYDFTNVDGSTFGEIASDSFDKYVEELGLADVRNDKEKTVEALVLGERMRSVSLYNEAFVHAVGQYDEIQRLARSAGPDSRFNLVSPISRNRLERASLDLVAREHSTGLRLATFDFPSIFAGVMNSKQVDERKVIKFDAWKSSFNATRKYVLSYLKAKYGSWPPKASSKKNDLEVDGLNRVVLKSLYYDMADAYDLFVDRTVLTTRTMDASYAGTTDEEGPDPNPGYPSSRILRRVFDEYDRSSPPVQPPVPFDQPIFPNLAHLTGGQPALNPADTKKLATKKLSSQDRGRLLEASVNSDTLALATNGKSHFLAAIRAFEAQQAKGCTINEIAELRAGMWIFIYAVIQALPMLVVDAPGVKSQKGVEYFLCQPPRLGVPWAKSGADRSRGWYSVSGGSGVVSLPSDLVEHGVEGVYRRSHCWLVANKWMSLLKTSLPSPKPVGASAAGQNKRWFPPTSTENTLDTERLDRVEIFRHESTRLAPPRPIRLSNESVRSSTGTGGTASGESGFNTPRSRSPHSRPHSRDHRAPFGPEAVPMPPAVSSLSGINTGYGGGERSRTPSNGSSAGAGWNAAPPVVSSSNVQAPTSWTADVPILNHIAPTPPVQSDAKFAPPPPPPPQQYNSNAHPYSSPYATQTDFYNGPMNNSNNGTRPPSRRRISGSGSSNNNNNNIYPISGTGYPDGPGNQPPPLPPKTKPSGSQTGSTFKSTSTSTSNSTPSSTIASTTVPTAATAGKNSKTTTHKQSASQTFDEILGSMGSGSVGGGSGSGSGSGSRGDKKSKNKKDKERGR